MIGALDGRSHHSGPTSPQEGFFGRGESSDRKIKIRKARLADLDAIFSIVSSAFAYPWSREMIADELRGKPWSKTLLATRGKDKVGFAIYWIVADEMHLLNFAVHPSWRRQGIGQMLMNNLINLMHEQNLCCILLEVRRSNDLAQSLYRNLGFEQIAVRQGYYSNKEDGLVMCLRRDS